MFVIEKKIMHTNNTQPLKVFYELNIPICTSETIENILYAKNVWALIHSGINKSAFDFCYICVFRQSHLKPFEMAMQRLVIAIICA